MPAKSKPPQRTDVRLKLRSQQLASLLQSGGLVACGTSTIPGIATHPGKAKAVKLLQQFKQRRGPFLLLAASKKEAAQWVRYWTPVLRKAMRDYWPGSTTIIFPGKPGLPRVCYQKGLLAIRVDGDPVCRRLAFRAGGVLISTSLNRKGKQVQQPDLSLRMRWHHYLQAGMEGIQSAGRPSALLIAKRARMHRLQRC